MRPDLPGIHHVTAIASDPQRNVDFYAGILGLRLVKQTVNFDDPTRYHLYFGDGAGSPGTLLTFFAWPDGERGRQGTGQFASIALSVPTSSLDFWRERFTINDIRHDQFESLFGEQTVAFHDPDGLPLRLIASPAAEPPQDEPGGSVPAAHAIRHVHSVELYEGDEDTDHFLVDDLEFRLVDETEDRRRYAVGTGGPGTLIDLIRVPGLARGVVAVGTIHHVAWRTEDDAAQNAWRTTLTTRHIPVTPVRDRQYFHSIYFNEPGGALFEIATDPPGFMIDESQEELGTHLKLPSQYESMRPELEELLIPLHPAGSHTAG